MYNSQGPCHLVTFAVFLTIYSILYFGLGRQDKHTQKERVRKRESARRECVLREREQKSFFEETRRRRRKKKPKPKSIKVDSFPPLGHSYTYIYIILYTWPSAFAFCIVLLNSILSDEGLLQLATCLHLALCTLHLGWAKTRAKDKKKIYRRRKTKNGKRRRTTQP